jgi:DNA polymerase-3 subunit gamma/tau
MGEKKKAAHQALYRKYRSKSLDEIVGQEHITTTLAGAIKQGKINHAYLFTGPRGTGKTSIARILAHEINKLPYKDDATHLDIVEIDAASNRRIDDIRDLRDKVHIAPISARYKVYIIDEVHMLTNESFNALLKTLEEPPEHVIFILATTEVHKLPATIISRAQRHSFRLIPLDKVVSHLSAIAKKEKITIDSAALQLLAEHGGGSFRDSISLLDQMSASDEPITTELIELLLGLAPQASLVNLLTSVKHGEVKEILQIVSELLASGLTPSAIAEQLLKIIRKELQENGSRQLAQLMHELLSVQSAQYPKLKLESVLLNSALANTPQNPYNP